jgi:predicted ArsR family transcriptional regulator
MAKRWTTEEDELLLKLRNEGFSAKEMTVHVDRTYSAIRMRLTTLEAKQVSRKWTDKDKALAWELKEQGNSNKFIARKLDRTPGAIASFFVRDEAAHYSKTIPGKNSS